MRNERASQNRVVELFSGPRRADGLEDNIRLRRAQVTAPNIEFYRHQVNFKLFKA